MANNLRTSTATGILPIGEVKLVDAIGSFSVRVFENGNHKAFSYGGKDAGSQLYRTLVKWTESGTWSCIEMSIGNGAVRTIWNENRK